MPLLVTQRRQITKTNLQINFFYWLLEILIRLRGFLIVWREILIVWGKFYYENKQKCNKTHKKTILTQKIEKIEKNKNTKQNYS